MIKFVFEYQHMLQKYHINGYNIQECEYVTGLNTFCIERHDVTKHSNTFVGFLFSRHIKYVVVSMISFMEGV